MAKPIVGAEALRAAVSEHLLNGYFDVRLLGGSGNKPGDGDYIPTAVEVHHDEATIHCRGRVTISILGPRDARVNHSGMTVLDASRVTVAKLDEVVYSAWIDGGGGVIAALGASTIRVPRVRTPRDLLPHPMFQLVRVEFG